VSEPTLPQEVLSYVGDEPEHLVGWGGGAVVRGHGVVAKVGPTAERNAFVLSLDLPVELPVLIDHGRGWVVMEDVPDHGDPWTPAELWTMVPDLAALHRAAVAPMMGSPLDEPLAVWIERVAAFGNLAVPMPSTLRAVLDKPGPLLEILSTSPRQLVHSDPDRRTIRRPSSGRRVWIDWDDAVFGPPALDLAAWLLEGPWYLGQRIDRDELGVAYHGDIDESHLDAAILLISRTQDLASLAQKGSEALNAFVDERMECVERLGLAG
jgi:hypothetical protein